MKKYFSFHGRAKRPQYWCVTLLIVVATILAVTATQIFGVSILIFGMVGFMETITGNEPTFNISPAFIVLLLFWLGFGVSTAWLWFALTARRLRDAGWNPWLTLVHLLPAVSVLSKILVEINPLFVVLDTLSLASTIAWIVFGCIKSKK